MCVWAVIPHDAGVILGRLLLMVAFAFGMGSAFYDVSSGQNGW